MLIIPNKRSLRKRDLQSPILGLNWKNPFLSHWVFFICKNNRFNVALPIISYFLIIIFPQLAGKALYFVSRHALSPSPPWARVGRQELRAIFGQGIPLTFFTLLLRCSLRLLPLLAFRSSMLRCFCRYCCCCCLCCCFFRCHFAACFIVLVSAVLSCFRVFYFALALLSRLPFSRCFCACACVCRMCVRASVTPFTSNSNFGFRIFGCFSPARFLHSLHTVQKKWRKKRKQITMISGKLVYFLLSVEQKALCPAFVFVLSFVWQKGFSRFDSRWFLIAGFKTGQRRDACAHNCSVLFCRDRERPLSKIYRHYSAKFKIKIFKNFFWLALCI